MDISRQMVAAQICGAHVRIVLQFTENVKEINLKIVGNFATKELLFISSASGLTTNYMFLHLRLVHLEGVTSSSSK
jgi:hypothetical protein